MTGLHPRTARPGALVALAACVVMAATPRQLVAQLPMRAAERLEGRFLRDSAASDDVSEAIERAVARMNFVTRPVGRSRLRATNHPPTDVRFELPADSIVIRYAGQPELRVRRDGSPREWRNAAGEPFEARVAVTAAADGGVTVHQSFVAEDGRRENAWRLDAAGTTLTLDVTVSSPRLPQPLRYGLVFSRASSAPAAPRP